MKIMITGADGFVGRYLVQEIASSCTDATEIIAVLGPRGDRMDLVKQLSKQVPIKVVKADFADSSSIARLIPSFKPDQIFHLAGAAMTHHVDVASYFTVNTIGTYRLAESILEHSGRTKLLYVSSGTVYGRSTSSMDGHTEKDPVNPQDPYSVSKLSAELLLSSLVPLGLDVRMVRSFNHTGPGQRLGYVCPDWIDRIKRSFTENRQLTANFDTGNIVRDFTDVRDVVKAYRLIMDRIPAGETVNMCSGRATKLSEILDYLEDVSGRAIYRPNDGMQNNPDILVGDSSKLHRMTGWTPTIGLAKTLKDMWEWDES